MNEKEKALLALCRVYKGEDKCLSKDADRQMLWHCEQWWVNQTILRSEEGCNLISNILSEYMDAGLSHFEPYDNIPVTLKATLFNRFCKYMDRGDIEEFKKFYSTIYMANK